MLTERHTFVRALHLRSHAMTRESSRCRDSFCEHDAPGCALPERAEPLGTFHLFRHHLLSAKEARAYPSTLWGWLQCRWHHGDGWKFEDELPPYALTASLSGDEMWCPVCEVVR